MDTSTPPTNKRKQGRNFGAEDARHDDEAFASSRPCQVCSVVSSEIRSFIIPKKTKKAENFNQNNDKNLTDSGGEDGSSRCVFVCPTCKDFYQRSVQSKSHLFYICPNRHHRDVVKVSRKPQTSHYNLNSTSSNIESGGERNSCPLNTIDSKNRCPSCWYQKCLDIGMNSNMTSSNNNNTTYTNNNNSNNQSGSYDNTNINSNRVNIKSKNFDNRPPYHSSLSDSSSSSISSQNHPHHGFFFPPSSSKNSPLISTATSSSSFVSNNISWFNNNQNNETNNSQTTSFTEVITQQQRLHQRPEMTPSSSFPQQQANPNLYYNSNISGQNPMEINPPSTGTYGGAGITGTIQQPQEKWYQSEKNQFAFFGSSTQNLDTATNRKLVASTYTNPQQLNSCELARNRSMFFTNPQQHLPQQKKISFPINKQGPSSSSQKHNKKGPGSNNNKSVNSAKEKIPTR